MLHDALAGLLDEKHKMRLPIAVIPCGSSNGFSKGIYSSVEPFEVAKSILLGAEHAANLVSARQAGTDSSGKTLKASEAPMSYDLVGISHAVVVDANTLTEKKLRWMNKLPFGGPLRDVMAALFLIGQMKMHRARIQIQPQPLTDSERTELCYTDPIAEGCEF